jgi:hypothetical protein
MLQYRVLLIRRSIWKVFHDQSNEHKNNVMKTIKGIPTWALTLIFLLLVNLIWMSWNLQKNGGFRAAIAASRFKVEALHTNDLSGIGIFERRTEQPLWTEWDFSHKGKPEMENYFFQGKDVFDITLSSNRPPRYTVFFPGPEKSGTWWLDRGGAKSFRGWFSGFQVEVNFSGFPFITGFGEDGAAEAQEGGFIGEEAGDAGAAFEFFIHALEWIGGAQAALVLAGKGEGGEALRQVFLHPGGEFGGGGGVFGDDHLEAGLGGEAVRAIEHRADGLGDGGALIQPGHISLGVLLEMKLAALPGHAREDRLPGGPETFVVITDEPQGGRETALLQAGEKAAPMDLGFIEGDADPQDGAFPVGADAQGDEHGAVEHLSLWRTFS